MSDELKMMQGLISIGRERQGIRNANEQSSLAAMPCSVAAPQSNWEDFTPEYDYEKKFYDVLLPSGEIVEGCWPNAGYMNGVMQRNGKWSGTDGVKVRLSLKHPMDD